ncbi:reticulon-like protein B11 [Hordeum vulgare]|nr:reticulon-like protein B11 [Hordeum vulgare]
MAATQHRPLHALLGGGAGTHAPPSSALSLPIRPICGADRPCPAAPRRAADLLLWRRRNASVTAVTGATLVWFVFERAGYSLASVLSNALLLLVIILFFWAKSASLLNRFIFPEDSSSFPVNNLDVGEELSLLAAPSSLPTRSALLRSTQARAAAAWLADAAAA